MSPSEEAGHRKRAYPPTRGEQQPRFRCEPFFWFTGACEALLLTNGRAQAHTSTCTCTCLRELSVCNEWRQRRPAQRRLPPACGRFIVGGNETVIMEE